MWGIRKSINLFMGNLSLKYKLFILLVVISMVPISLVSYSSQYFMFRSSTEYSSSISSQYVQFVSKEISSYLQDVSRSFDSLFTNSAFQKYLDIPQDDLVSQANYEIIFQPIQRNVLQLRNEILGVLYLDQVGKIYFESYQKRLNFDYSLLKDPLYRSVFQLNKPQLSVPHTMNYTLGSKERVISLMRPIHNLRTGKIVSWYVIEIKEDQIKGMLSGAENKHQGHLLLYHQSDNTPVSNVKMDATLLDDFRSIMDSNSPHKNEFIFTSQGDKYEAAYRNLTNSDWKLVWIAPLNNITEGARHSTNWTLLIAVVSLAISLIFSFPVMRIVLTPLYKLKSGMQSLGRGSYIPIPSQYNQDEFGFLIKSYNQMLNELQRMELEVFQSKIKEKEKELLQLQAQINPHFLFNTLETIDSYASKNNSEAVGEMVQSVSHMMRYNVRNDGGWAPLKEEIAYIRNFLNIHFYRNGKDVNVNFELDPSILNVRIMKLSMQPFVENAIKYGWSPHMSDEAFTLTIKAEQREGFLFIAVRDTGTGISEEIMDKLSELIDSKTELVDPYFQKHTGIFNVFRRFLLAYGNQVTFVMTTSPDEGTCVQIKLPLDDAKT